MSGPDWALAAVLVLAAGIVLWSLHWHVLDARLWPLVGSEWRAMRSGQAVIVMPGPSPQDLPGPSDDRAPAAGGRAGELVIEWEDLDPDEQADQLIAEWHDEGLERSADTDALRLLDDAELLLWDCRRQVERIQDVVHDWRLEMGDLLAWYAAELESRGAA